MLCIEQPDTSCAKLHAIEKSQYLMISGYCKSIVGLTAVNDYGKCNNSSPPSTGLSGILLSIKTQYS